MFPAVSALALRIFLALAPPTEDSAEPPTTTQPTSADEQTSAPTEPPTEGPVPPPRLDVPPEVPPPEIEPDQPSLEPGEQPPGTTPPGESGGVVVPDSPAGEPELEWEDERAFADLPYLPTPARKSAIRRNNDISIRPFRKPLFSIAAAARMGVQLTSGREIVQPFGYGFAAQLRLHFARVIKSRFGFELHAGHTRWQQRQDFEPIVVGSSEATVTRIMLLTHTDFSVGPSFEIPIGAVFLQLGAGAGVAVSTLSRPRSADAREDQQLSNANPLVRGGVSLGIPILNRHGLALGTGVHHVFSQREVTVDPVGDPEGAKAVPFATWLEVYGAYQIWF